MAIWLSRSSCRMPRLGTVRAVDSQDLEACRIDAVVMNTFHLMQHPGSSTVQALGGLHRMAGWPHPWRAQAFASSSCRSPIAAASAASSKVAGSLRGSLNAGLKIDPDLRARGAGADAATCPLRAATSPLSARSRRRCRAGSRRLLDRGRCGEHRIRRALHVGNGAGDAFQHRHDRPRAHRCRGDVVRDFAGGRVLLLDRARDRGGE